MASLHTEKDKRRGTLNVHFNVRIPNFTNINELSENLLFQSMSKNANFGMWVNNLTYDAQNNSCRHADQGFFAIIMADTHMVQLQM